MRTKASYITVVLLCLPCFIFGAKPKCSVLRKLGPRTTSQSQSSIKDSIPLDSLVAEKKRKSYTLSELTNILNEAAEKMEIPIQEFKTSPDISLQKFRPSSLDSVKKNTDTISFETLIKYWNQKLDEESGKPHNPGISLTKQQLLRRWQESVNAAPSVPERTLRLDTLVPKKRLKDYTVKELNDVLLEAKRKLESKGITFTRNYGVYTTPLAPHGSEESKTVEAVLINWAVKTYQPPPGKKRLGTEDIFNPKKSNCNAACWVRRWLAENGFPKLDPETKGTPLMALWRNGVLERYSEEELNNALTEASAAFQKMPISSKKKGIGVQTFTLPDKSESFSFDELLKHWAVEYHNNRNPEKGLSLGKVVTESQGGKPIEDWFEIWRTENNIQLKSRKKGTTLTALINKKKIRDYTAEELDRALFEACLTIINRKTDNSVSVAEQRQNVVESLKKINLGHFPLRFTTPDDSVTTTLNTLLLQWALKTHNSAPENTQLNTSRIMNRNRGGKSAALWFSLWKKQYEDPHHLQMRMNH